MSEAVVAAAVDAKRALCEVAVKGYQHDTADTSERRQYVECVKILYPHEIPESVILAAQATGLVILAAALIGAVIGWRESRFDKIGGAFAGAVLGGVLAALAAIVVWVLVVGL